MIFPTLPLPDALPTLAAWVAAFFIGSTLLGLAVGYALERFGPRRIWAVPVPAGQRALEVRGNITFVAVCIVTLTAVLHADVVRVGDETPVRVVLTWLALFFGFQAFYYVLHRAMHTRALVRFHRHHHESRVTTPLSGQSTSLGEALGWMLGYAGLPALLSLVAPISQNAWIAYLAFNVIGNIVGHANGEVVPPARFLWARAAVAGTFTYHALHHARWTENYAFESTWADRLFGTEATDWLPLHKRIWSGAPMTSLKERGG